MGLRRGHAAVEHNRGHTHPLGHQGGDQLGRERPTGARHLRTAVLVGVHGAVGGQRPRPGHVPVADGRAVDAEVGGERRPQVEGRDPQPPVGGSPRLGQSGTGSGGQANDLADPPIGERQASDAVGRAQLDQPPFTRQAAGQVQAKEGAVGPHGLESGGHGARCVDDDQVSGRQDVDDVGEATMGDAPLLLASHHQAHIVAAPAPHLGRLGGLMIPGEVEGHHLGRGRSGGDRGADGDPTPGNLDDGADRRRPGDAAGGRGHASASAGTRPSAGTRSLVR